MNTIPFASQKTKAITFPVDDTTLAFTGGGEEGCFHFLFSFLFFFSTYICEIWHTQDHESIFFIHAKVHDVWNVVCKWESLP